jgi:uncharacterized GH25 family protein
MLSAYSGRVACALLGLTLMSQALGHDIWIEANQSLIRTGDRINLSLMLGNHGNQHRDFRLASKVSAGQQNLRLISPKGASYDLTPNMIDNGYEPKEGFWSTGFECEEPGIYQAVSTFDQVMSYAPVRDIKTSKTFFAAARSMDKPEKVSVGFDKPIGTALELVAVSNPVSELGRGSIFEVKVLFNGKPVAGHKVSFIPKGVTLQGDVDPRYEVNTDADGVASLALGQAGQWLIAAHLKDDKASGEGYKSIGYSATIHLVVPTTCPCCVGGIK